MKMLCLFLMIIVLARVPAQNPELKVYIDSVELKNNDQLISVSAKIGKEYFSILSADKSRIVLQQELDLLKIASVRFILATDTVTFTIDKILEGTSISSETVKMTALKIIFHSIKRWHLRVERFKHSDEKAIGSVAGVNKEDKIQERNNFKIYSLRTLNWKFYIVKA